MSHEFDERDFTASRHLQIWKRMDELSIMIFPKKLRILMLWRACAGRILKRRYGASFTVLCGSACTCLRMSLEKTLKASFSVYMVASDLIAYCNLGRMKALWGTDLSIDYWSLQCPGRLRPWESRSSSWLQNSVIDDVIDGNGIGIFIYA